MRWVGLKEGAGEAVVRLPVLLPLSWLSLFVFSYDGRKNTGWEGSRETLFFR